MKALPHLSTAAGRSAAALATLFFSTTSATTSSSVAFDCGGGCLDRAAHSIKAIVHGTAGDPFWQQVQAAAVQAASDMRVNLEMDLYDAFDAAQMAADVRAHVASNPPQTGMLVTIPTEEVGDAIKEAVDAGIPVVGMNTGAAFGESAGSVGFVAPDDIQGGKLAGGALLSQSNNATNIGEIYRGLFVDEHGNKAGEDRLAGFRDVLESAYDSSFSIDTIAVDATDAAMEATITDQLDGCGYHSVLLSGPRSLSAAIAAYEANGCTLEEMPLGAFETGEEVWAALGDDKLSFTIDNNQYLQGALGTIVAALAVTTGKALAPSAYHENGAYLPGPSLVTKATLPSDTTKVCEADAFPVCPNSQRPDGTESSCDCADRSKLKIGGVTHGTTTDGFWDPVFAASAQAAGDLNVALLNERFDAGDAQGSNTLHTRMSNRIEDLCTRQDVDGIFVSIPSENVVPGIQSCLDLNIPVISINAGEGKSSELGLMHHIGMLEFNAGKAAGERLVEGSGITSGVCVNHAEGVNVVEERCAGFEAALEEAGVPYIGEVYVPDDNEPLYIEAVENIVNLEGDWSGGQPQHGPAISLQKLHPMVRIGAFDASAELYDAIDAGVVEFTMDQEPYLQGFMPVILLTYMATTNQAVSNRVVESGPSFITSSPSDEQLSCEQIFYTACVEEEPDTSTDATTNDEQPTESSANVGLIAGICVLAAVLVLMSVYFIHRLNAVNKHVAELKAQGKSVRRVSMSQRAMSLVKPVDQVVLLEEDDDAEKPEAEAVAPDAPKQTAE